MGTYARHLSTRQTPQAEPIPGSGQVPNSAGGHAWAVDDWTRLDRFLILGNEGGSYYASERALTIENAAVVLRCLDADAHHTVRRIVEVSEAGRAPKNDPAIFALALAAAYGKDRQPGDPVRHPSEGVGHGLAVRRRALEALPRVCRTGTHLFQFVECVREFRGWGPALAKAVGRWYTDKDPRELAYQVTKYQQRGGWSHRDLLRLAHPKIEAPREVHAIAPFAVNTRQSRAHVWGDTDDPHALIARWCLKGWPWVGEQPHPIEAMQPIWAFERAKKATTTGEVVRLIREHGLVRECVPTPWLNAPEVWDALLERMPLTAMVRNLATMTRVGLLSPLSAATGKVSAALSDVGRLRNSRLHPVALLVAQLTYAAGRGERGKHTWTPVPQITDALDAAFYASFGNVEPTGKRWLLALDVSGSMDGGTVAGVPGLTPRVASAAMAMITAAVEPHCAIMGFTSGGHWIGRGLGRGLSFLDISPGQRLDAVCNYLMCQPMGGTDCALPILYAMEHGPPEGVDVFVTYTDSESWAGEIHAAQALNLYRRKVGVPAKAICVGMVANDYTVLDPNDAGSLNVAGFDTATPQVMASFAAGAAAQAA